MLNRTAISLAILALIVAGCGKQEKSHAETDDPIVFSFSVDGSPVSDLALDNNAAYREIEVNVNRDDLVWDIVSDKSWCQVLPGEHCGPGNFSFIVNANNSFDAREEATLTLVSGEEEYASLEIAQGGADCLLAQRFFICPKDERSLELDVLVKRDKRIRFDCDEWVNVEEISGLSMEDTKLYTIKIWGSDNGDESRYGLVTFYIDDDGDSEKSVFYLYQFGNDVNYDADGKILIPGGQEGASISFKAPYPLVKEILCPDFASCSVHLDRDQSATYMIEFEQNQTGAPREIAVSVILNDDNSTSVDLPAIIQDTPSES